MNTLLKILLILHMLKTSHITITGSSCSEVIYLLFNSKKTPNKPDQILPVRCVLNGIENVLDCHRDDTGIVTVSHHGEGFSYK